jgi:copper(I)-binding protein
VRHVYRPPVGEILDMRTREQRLRRGLPGSAAVVLTLSVGGCHNDAVLDSSNRGSGSHTAMTSVENAFIVPMYMPGHCAIQLGDVAKLRFTASNNRDTEAERLLLITTDAADAVRISPTSTPEIQPNSTIAAGQPLTQNDADPRSLDVTLQGLRHSAKPGTSVTVAFDFEKAGSIDVRTPLRPVPPKVSKAHERTDRARGARSG